MQILFSFTYNVETKEAVITGNISVLQALHVLQNIAFSAASQRPKGEPEETPGDKPES